MNLLRLFVEEHEEQEKSKEESPAVDSLFLREIIVDQLLSLGLGVSFGLEFKTGYVIRLELFDIDFVLAVSPPLKLLLQLSAGLATHDSVF